MHAGAIELLGAERAHHLDARVADAHPYSNTYVLTPEGLRWALFYTKLQDRLLGPLLAADQPPASVGLRRALRVIDDSIDRYIDAARMRPAA
ncbi:MAG: hypothetical protein AAB284_00955 [Chloroflexota bacterium]